MATPKYRGKARRLEGPVPELGAGARRLVRHLPLELRLFGATLLDVSLRLGRGADSPRRAV